MFKIDEWRQTFSEFAALSKTSFPSSLKGVMADVIDSAQKAIEHARQCEMHSVLDKVASCSFLTYRMSDLVLKGHEDEVLTAMVRKSFGAATAGPPTVSERYYDALRHFNEQLIEEIVLLLKEECDCRSK